MAESQTSRKFELNKVMLAMDVVDTLRHQQSLVQRELDSEGREQALIEKLRKIYADQGLEVSDEIIAQGVKALQENRFTYKPPRKGLKTTLAQIYVNRARWAKLTAILLVGLIAVWVGYRFFYVVPAERSRAKLIHELEAQVGGQQDRIKVQKGQIEAVLGALAVELKSVPDPVSLTVERLANQARTSLDSARKQLDALEKLPPLSVAVDGDVEERASLSKKRVAERADLLSRSEEDLKNAGTALQTIQTLKLEAGELESAWSAFRQSSTPDPITKSGEGLYQSALRNLQEGKTGNTKAIIASLEALRTMPEMLASLRTRALGEAREGGLPDRIDALYRNAISSLQAGDIQGARSTQETLQSVCDLISQEYTVQIVSRPGTPSGVWRHPENNPSARNYYLIVEAVAPSGQRLDLPITSEEDGKTRTVSEWGLRVDARAYEQVKQDKMEDGIVNRKTVGVKKRGHLTPEYLVSTTGGAITEW